MKNLKIILASVLTVIAIPIFSLNSETVTESVRKSLEICYCSVIPSLLPFFIISNFLTALALSMTVPAGMFAFFSSLIVGFPTGVKNVCDLYKSGAIDRKSANALLHCTANASPAYIVTFIGKAIIKSTKAGVILLISQIIAAIACFLFFKGHKKTGSCSGKAISLTQTACRSVTDGVMSCLYVCGYIVFFGIIADLILKLELPFLANGSIKSIFIGLIEISRGMSFIDFKDGFAIISAAVILAFSGVSVIMQCIGCIVKVGLSARALISGKLAYTVIMPPIAYIISRAEIGTMQILSCIFIIAAAVLVYNIFDKSRRRIYNK